MYIYNSQRHGLKLSQSCKVLLLKHELGYHIAYLNLEQCYDLGWGSRIESSLSCTSDDLTTYFWQTTSILPKLRKHIFKTDNDLNI